MIDSQEIHIAISLNPCYPASQMRRIELLVVHHSASPRDTTIRDIRKWHIEERGWQEIGYHYVVHEDGSLHIGRPIHEKGAHAYGVNDISIGICLVGNNLDPREEWTRAQISTLFKVYEALKLLIPKISIVPHTEAGSTITECPGKSLKKLSILEI